jgi:hypothetical protein
LFSFLRQKLLSILKILFRGLNVKALLVIFLAVYLGFSLCSLSNALSPMQNVGEDYGRTWLTQYSNKFVTTSSNNTNDLWKWGGEPRGYEVFQGRLYPLLSPAELYYPGFITNSTPIFLNGTAYMRDQRYMYLNYIPPYTSPNSVTDPWLLAQMTDRPIVVVYPAEDGRSTLR